MPAAKRWLGFFPESQGRIVIDAGAATALCQNGKSLLPGGITSVEENFDKGAVVDLINEEGQVLARGLSNYQSDDIEKIKGKQSSEIDIILGGSANYVEAVHRDNLLF